MFSGLVDVSKLNKIKFHSMKKCGQNITPSMIDAIVIIAGVFFVPIWKIPGPNLHLCV